MVVDSCELSRNKNLVTVNFSLLFSDLEVTTTSLKKITVEIDLL